MVFIINAMAVGQDKNLVKQLSENLIKENLAGAVWAIVDSNGTIQTGAAGFNHVPQKIMMKPTDKVNVGSITKAVISTGILKLSSDGRLLIDEPVNKYLPEVKFQNPWEATNPITIRHLLYNTSGLGDLRFWHIFSTRAQPNTPLSKFYESDNSVLKIYTRPGTVYSYSNMGFTLLGMVIESITHKPYEKYINETILMPIGMKNSTFNFVSQVSKNIDKSLAMGHYDGGSIAPNMPIMVRPAAQFTTTAYDMGLFLRFVMNSGRINDKQWISEKYMLHFGKPLGTNAVKNGLSNGYSCGMYMRDRYGVKGIYGLGSIIGYRAVTYIFPKQNKSFFIAYNMDSEVADYETFNKIMIAYLGINKNENLHKPEAQSSDLKEFEGYYVPVVTKYEPYALSDFMTGFIQIQSQGKQFLLKPFQQSSKKLTQLYSNIFIGEDRTEASHSFYKYENNLYFSDGLKTDKKVNGFQILGAWVSVVLGIIGIIYILISGFYQLIKFKKVFPSLPIFWAFLGVLTLFLPIPFFLTQPFVEIANKSAASILLMLSTIIMPFGVLSSFLVGFKKYTKNKLLTLALLFTLQFILFLGYWGLLPLMLWV